MRILLVGEYSGLHSNLKIGLELLGCEVDLISSGDGWKRIPGGRNMNSRAWFPMNILIDELNLKYLNFANSCGSYDVVQFINPLVLNTRFQVAFKNLSINKSFIKRLIDKSKKSFLLAAGDDHYYMRAIESGLFEYNPVQFCGESELPIYKRFYNINWKNPLLREWNIEMVNMVDGVIPCLYEYDVGYENEGIAKKRPYIPFPFDATSVAYQKNVLNDNMRVVHVKTRGNYKGSHIVDSAFKMLESKKEVECEFLGKMPYADFKRVLRKTNVIVDQLNSYSYAYTAINALAAGKIVIGGFEEKIVERYNITKCPAIVNCKPDPLSLKEAINRLYDEKDKFESWSESGRKFVEDMHGCEKVASLYLKEWAR